MGSGEALGLGMDIVIEDWSRGMCPWQQCEGRAWLEPQARVRAGAGAIDERLRRVLEMRYGWGGAPLTLAEAAESLRMPAMRVAVMERRGIRQARRAA